MLGKGLQVAWHPKSEISHSPIQEHNAIYVLSLGFTCKQNKVYADEVEDMEIHTIIFHTNVQEQKPQA